MPTFLNVLQNVMSAGESLATGFVDRRESLNPVVRHNSERRQFTNSHDGLSPDAAELANAIDQYKLMNRRRYITYEEMLSVVQSLGYQKTVG